MLVKELNREATATHLRLLEPFEEGRERLSAWTRAGLDRIERYGATLVEIASNVVPAWSRELIDVSEAWRFIGRAVKDCKRRGCIEREPDTRLAVHGPLSLAHPDHDRRRRVEGKTAPEVIRETMRIFFGAFGHEDTGPQGPVRAVAAVGGRATRWPGSVVYPGWPSGTSPRGASGSSRSASAIYRTSESHTTRQLEAGL